MKNVDLYLKVRRAVRIEGLSERATARRFGIDPRTVNKMMKFSVPPGYVRKKPPAKPKLDRFIPMIDGILGDDKSRPKKQQHTAKRIFERLRDEHALPSQLVVLAQERRQLERLPVMREQKLGRIGHDAAPVSSPRYARLCPIKAPHYPLQKGAKGATAVEKWRHVVLALKDKTLQPVRPTQKQLPTEPSGP